MSDENLKHEVSQLVDKLVSLLRPLTPFVWRWVWNDKNRIVKKFLDNIGTLREAKRAFEDMNV